MTLFLFTWWSDRIQQRFLPIVVSLGILLVGLAAVILLPHEFYGPRYAGLCVLLAGSFISSPLTVAWLSNNIPDPAVRVIVLGINGWGNIAGVFSALLFAPSFAPGYGFPLVLTAICVGFSAVGFLSFRTALKKQNRRRQKKAAREEGDTKIVLYGL